MLGEDKIWQMNDFEFASSFELLSKVVSMNKKKTKKVKVTQNYPPLPFQQKQDQKDLINLPFYGS